MLKKLGWSDSKTLVSKDDYSYLSKICENRYHLAHNVFLNLSIKKDWLYPREYQKQCDKLNEDRQRVVRTAKILEEIQTNYCARIRK